MRAGSQLPRHAGPARGAGCRNLTFPLLFPVWRAASWLSRSARRGAAWWTGELEDRTLRRVVYIPAVRCYCLAWAVYAQVVGGRQLSRHVGVHHLKGHVAAVAPP